MKMAKASEADLRMALDLTRALEMLEQGYFPDDHDEDTEREFNCERGADCVEAIDTLLRILQRGSLMRVVFGMAVVLDPKNEIVDPDKDYLDLHPKHANKENEMIDPKLSELADRFQVMSDNSYIRYLDRCRADECLGYEYKMEKGSFGRAELDAHKLATEALGKHKAYQLCANELRSIIAELNKEPT